MSDIEHGCDILLEEANEDNKIADNLDNTDGTSVATSTTPSTSHRKWSPSLLSCAMISFGVGLTSAFLAIGVHDVREDSWQQWQEKSTDIARRIGSSWSEYETFGLWAHESCHQLPSTTQNSTKLDDIFHICSRDEFRDIYEQILSVGLDVHSLQYATKVEHRYREQAEAESRRWLEKNYPGLSYQGFTARKETDEGPVVFPVPDRPFYFPLRRIEPFLGNEMVYDKDTYYSHPTLISSVFETMKPSLSPPIKTIQSSTESGYSVFFVHPGSKTSVHPEDPHSLVAMIVRVRDLLSWACRGIDEKQRIYLYDSTENDMSFLEAIELRPTGNESRIAVLPDIAFVDVPVPKRSQKLVTTIAAVDRQWTVVIVRLENSDVFSLILYVIGASLIFVIFFILAFVLRRYLVKWDVINALVFDHKTEKANSYHKQVMRERRLNEYLA